MTDLGLHVAARIKAIRTAQAMTQTHLATALGLSKTSIVHIEGGNRQILVRELPVFASTLGVTVQDLISAGPVEITIQVDA